MTPTEAFPRLPGKQGRDKITPIRWTSSEKLLLGELTRIIALKSAPLHPNITVPTMPALHKTPFEPANIHNGTNIHFSVYSSPAASTDTSIDIQTLAVDIIGVLLTGLGLIMLALQLWERYHSQGRKERGKTNEDASMETAESLDQTSAERAE